MNKIYLLLLAFGLDARAADYSSSLPVNTTMFGNTSISTGTGVSGLGIPRFTISNDSNILSTQSGTWTVQQGSTATSVANGWPVKLTDGTNTTAVKAASTAAAAADPSAVVALSPNSPLPAGTNSIGLVTTKTPLTANAPFQVSAGVTSGVFLASNSVRKGMCAVNVSNATVSFNAVAGSAVLNSGITLYPGGTWCMDEFTFTTSAINIIAGAASSVVSGQEFQ